MQQFTKKAVQPQQSSGGSGGDSDAWYEWNQYVFDTFTAKVSTLPNGKQRKEKVLIGKVNFIFDLGTPPAEDSKWETKCTLPAEGEKYSQEELAYKEKNPTHDFVWADEWNENTHKNEPVRKQTSPSYPSQEWGICVDVPQLMLDYSKHPNSTSQEEDLRPYRISMNRSFHQKFNKTITFDAGYKGVVSEKNLVYKICAAAGREKQLIESQFDIATAAEAVANFTVRLDLQVRDDGGVYLNPAITKPAPVDDFINPVTDEVTTAESQINAVMSKGNIAPFVGVLLNGMDYTDEMLGMIGNDTYGYVKRASQSSEFEISGISKKTGKPYSFMKGVNYQGSDFQKAWDAKTGTDSGSQQQPQPEPQKQPVVQEPTPKPQVSEPDLDFDTDIPF